MSPYPAPFACFFSSFFDSSNTWRIRVCFAARSLRRCSLSCFELSLHMLVIDRRASAPGCIHWPWVHCWNLSSIVLHTIFVEVAFFYYGPLHMFQGRCGAHIFLFDST